MGLIGHPQFQRTTTLGTTDRRAADLDGILVGRLRRDNSQILEVDLAATGWLLIGSVPGVLIGGRFTVRIPDRSLRVLLAATLTLAGVKLVDPPGANAIVIGGAVIGAVAVGTAFVRWLGTRGTPPVAEIEA